MLPPQAVGSVWGAPSGSRGKNLRITDSAEPGILGWDPGAPTGWVWNLKMLRSSVARILGPQYHSILGLAPGYSKS